MAADTQTTPSSCPFTPGTLWHKVQAQTDHALRCGALQPIPTHYDFIEQDGVAFLVRSLANLARKKSAQKQQEKTRAEGKPSNPFLPYEADLFVTDLSDTHLCLLNKFNVVDHHLLIVTRDFEEQETWLTLHDFVALWRCMAEIEGLAFYNGGRLAGASQPHKHLQLVPNPLSPQGHSIPIEAKVMNDRERMKSSSANGDEIDGSTRYTVELPFAHAIAPLSLSPELSDEQASQIMIDAYESLLSDMGIEKPAGSKRQTLPYNLLATRSWMMLVPRSQESYASISVNSLGFAGSLFVKDEDQMQILKQHGPMTILSNVALPKSRE